MSHLSPDAQEALSALQNDVATPSQRERMRARLVSVGVAVSVASTSAAASAGAAAGAVTAGQVSTLAAPLHVATATQAAAATTSVAGKLATASTLAKLAALPWAIKAVTVVGAVGLALAAPRAFTPADKPVVTQPQRVAQARPSRMQQAQPVITAPAATTPAPIVPAPVNALSPLTQKARAGAGTRTREVTAVAVSSVAATGSQLAAESVLLSDALRALRAGQLHTARAYLDRHEQTFGAQALLSPERHRLREELTERTRAQAALR